MHCMNKYRMNTGTWKNVLLFLAKVSGLDINEELRKENEYLKAEIEIYRKQLERLGRRPQFTDGMRMRLVEKALALGKRMRDVVTIVRPDTILKWQRRMVAALYDSSKSDRCGTSLPSCLDCRIRQSTRSFFRELNSRGARVPPSI